MRRPLFRLLLLLLTVTSLGLASCGTDTDPTDLGARPTTDPTAAPGGGAGIEATIFLTRGDELVPAGRTVAEGREPDVVLADTIRSLLAGPSAAERDAGLGTEIPEGTRLLDARIDGDGVASVDLSGEFETGAGTASIQARLGQVACTVDALGGGDLADGLHLLLDGQPVQLFSSEGVVLDDPISCADYQPRATEGGASAACATGWVSPPSGDDRRSEALDLLRISTGTADRFVVEDMRYFRGPDATDPTLQVEHWYAKVRSEADPSFRGRFLITRRDGSAGVVAVAPFDSSGWSSPDWAGFEGEGELTAFPDLPGRWAGVRYDFVTGTGGPGTAGLPAAVVGCLDGT